MIELFPLEPEYNEEEWTPALKYEVATIANCGATKSDSVQVVLGTDGELYLHFLLFTDKPVENADIRILDEEPVVFFYSTVDVVGLKAPSVWSNRKDFPKDIGHINPTPVDMPASLCLARSGLQTVYEHHGISGILLRLSDWYGDARTGNLMIDGWEPIPSAYNQQMQLGLFDAAFFQDHAHSVGTAGSATGVVCMRKSKGTPQEDYLILENELCNEYNKEEKSRCFNGELTIEAYRSFIPWVFVWPGPEMATDDPIFGHWQTYSDMLNGLKAVGLDESINNAVMRTQLEFGETCTLNGGGGRTYVVVIGMWRTKPIIPQIMGLSKNEEARKLELRAFAVHWTGGSEKAIDDASQVVQVSNWCPPSREMMSKVSGIKEECAQSPITIIGSGAIGSLVVDFLLRGGFSSLTVIDPDTVQPHNLARHDAIIDHIFMPKCELAKMLSFSLVPIGTSPAVNTIDKNLIDIDSSELATLFSDSNLVLDCTANETVRQYLSVPMQPDNTPILRCELYYGGRLGVLFKSPPCTSLIDLYYLLITLALENDMVADWLFSEETNETVFNELLVGFGCASASTVLPKYIVSQHASTFMPDILSGVDGVSRPQVVLNPVDDSGRPLGVQTYDFENTCVLVPNDASNWSIRMAGSAVEAMRQLRIEAGTVETGGYLYGGMDLVTRTIYVTVVSELPPNSTATSSSLELGAAGKTLTENKIKRRCGGKLSLVGTWHSHPNSSAAASQKDINAMKKVIEQDKKNGLPSLLLITAPDEIAAHLWE